jgi:outer membrane lipoprotein-sorting protein
MKLDVKSAAAIVALGIILSICILASGCATPPAKPQLAPFERCMESVGKTFYYTSDRVSAANWCAGHDNGGIKEQVK